MKHQPDNDPLLELEETNNVEGGELFPEEELSKEWSEVEWTSENACPIWNDEEPHEYRITSTPTGRSLFRYCIYCEEMSLVDVTKLVQNG